MQNGHRWVVREKNSGKWIKGIDDSPFKVNLIEDLAEALRYATRFRAEEDASYLTMQGKKEGRQTHGMFFEVWEFEDSDRSRQVYPYLVFTPSQKQEKDA